MHSGSIEVHSGSIGKHSGSGVKALAYFGVMGYMA